MPSGTDRYYPHFANLYRKPKLHSDRPNIKVSDKIATFDNWTKNRKLTWKN